MKLFEYRECVFNPMNITKIYVDGVMMYICDVSGNSSMYTFNSQEDAHQNLKSIKIELENL